MIEKLCQIDRVSGRTQFLNGTTRVTKLCEKLHTNLRIENLSILNLVIFFASLGYVLAR